MQVRNLFEIRKHERLIMNANKGQLGLLDTMSKLVKFPLNDKDSCSIFFGAFLSMISNRRNQTIHLSRCRDFHWLGLNLRSLVYRLHPSNRTSSHLLVTAYFGSNQKARNRGNSIGPRSFATGRPTLTKC